MKKVRNILLGAILICHFSFGQTSKTDSLETILNDENKHDTLRLEAGRGLFMIHFRNNLDTARAIGNSMLLLAKNKNLRTWEANAYKLIGNSYAVQGNYTKALEAFINCHKLMQQLSNKRGMSVTYNNIGIVYYEQGNYPEALKYLYQGLKLSEELNDNPGVARVTNNLGNVYIRQKNNKKALEYYTYSLRIKKEIGNKYSLAKTYNNIGLTYTNLNNHDLALENLLKSANISEEVNDRMSITRAYNNIGVEYNERGDFKKALDYLNKSIQIKKEISDKEGLSFAYVLRGKTYLNQNNYQLAKGDCEQGLNLGLEMGALIVQKEACECLSEAWRGLGNSNKSLQYYKQSVSARDSLFNQEKTREITRQEMQYQFEKQQLADSIAFHKQKAEQELLFEKNINKQRNKLNLIILGSLGLLLIGGIYWRSRQKSIKLAQERKVINKLKQVDQLKDQFLANTSHELRTPLNGIIGLTESLKDGVAGKLSSKAIDNLDMIASSGKRLSHLVNDILDFSKLKNKDLVLSIHPIDIHASVDLVLKLSEPLTRGKKLTLINAISTEIPLVEADENRLQQILHNLIGNAVKFTEKGQIIVTAEEKDKMVLISISDTGIGIAEEKFKNIFKSFEQVDGTTERGYAGTGLGLSVSKQLVELHGGTINLTSEVGKGSVFTFSLPSSSQKQKDLQQADKFSIEKIKQLRSDTLEQSDTSIPGLNSVNSGIRILIVDDEPVNRRVLENHLMVAGYNITEVGNGQEALTLIDKGETFDLVLLDVMMPGISGYEVCERIRKKYLSSELPIVLLTAKNNVSDLVNGFSVGANDYLTKPFSKNELLTRIKTHINLTRIHKATSKFVPTEFLKSVGREGVTDVVLGDNIQKEVTVLFTDVRNYTRLAESMTPQQNFKFVNAYVGKMGPLIQQNNGFVNQYLGDGIMALFPQEANHALQSTIEMQRAITTYNIQRVEEGFVPISVGMGLHTGPLVMGIIGDSNRNDTAIIADTVNTASRMEGITKHYGARIIASEDSLNTIENKNEYNFRYLGKVQVKGKDNAIGIYECYDGDEQESITLKTKTLENFEKGLKYFLNKEFPKALADFDKVLSENPKDAVAKYFVTKSAEYTISGVPQDTEVVNTMHQK